MEDNAVNQRVVLAMLRKKDYKIDVANNGQEALDKLERATEPYNLILMDVQMPVLDGLETTRAIRRNTNWDYLPIIAMTAHAMIGDRERCLQAGMNAYISKPVQQAGLIAVIEQYLASGTGQASVSKASGGGTDPDRQTDAAGPGPGERNASPVHGSGAGAAGEAGNGRGARGCADARGRSQAHRGGGRAHRVHQPEPIAPGASETRRRAEISARSKRTWRLCGGRSSRWKR